MYKIAVLPGDGIGPEIIKEAIKVLKALEQRIDIKFDLKELKIGGAAFDLYSEPLPKETLEHCRESNAILLGAVGGPKWDNLPSELRPEKALLELRKELELYGNIRPVKIFKPLIDSSPLKKEIINGTDLLVIRELTGGIYFGEKVKEETDHGIRVTDKLTYTELEIERIVRLGFETGLKRNKKLTSVDKANVLESSRLWRNIVNKVAKDYQEVEVVHMYIDNCAMQLIRDPKQFDVIVTENMFGDILSDEAAMLTGSIGMLPSASIGNKKIAMYEPIHGSAPDIAGLGLANPIGTILSMAMMLRYSFHMNKEADKIENAVQRVLEKGFRTKDIASEDSAVVSTQRMGDLIVDSLIKEIIIK